MSKLEELQERVDFLEKQIERYQKEDQKRFEATVEAYVSAQARFLQMKARADNLEAQAKEKSKKIPRWYNMEKDSIDYARRESCEAASLASAIFELSGTMYGNRFFKEIHRKEDDHAE